jgi:opacity protein-like surface antigen
MRLTVWTVLALLSVVVSASAQDKKVEVNLGAGYSVVTGEARDSTGDAGVFEAGVTYYVSPNLGIQADYNYTALGKEKTVVVNVSPIPGGIPNPEQFSADWHMHDFTFNAIVRSKTEGRVVPFGLVGPGVYHRTVNLTTPAVGYATVCDPYWYVCYPTAVAVDQIIGSRSSTDFGINFGGGVSFKVGETASVYFQVKWAYIWGPTFDVPAVGSTPAQSLGSNAQVFPFIFGVKW